MKKYSEMRYINYLLIVFGSGIAFYATRGQIHDLPLLVIGLVLLILGVYRISRTLNSRLPTDEFDIKSENDKEI